MTDHKKAFRAATLAVRIDPDNNLAAAYIELAVQLEAERKTLAVREGLYKEQWQRAEAAERRLATAEREPNAAATEGTEPGDYLQPFVAQAKLREKYVQAKREALRLEGMEEAAKIAELRKSYSMPISCPDNILGCCVAHYIRATREQTGTEVAEAIRAEIDRRKAEGQGTQTIDKQGA